MAGSKQLEQTSKSIDSSAHMITTARVPADKPVRIAFSLNDSPDDASSENFPLAFPDLDQQLQPLPPCHDSKESMQVYKQHCKIAEEYHEVKKEIALLEERKSTHLWNSNVKSHLAVPAPAVPTESTLCTENTEDNDCQAHKTDRANTIDFLARKKKSC
ncbi:MAP3K7 C-terminal-like protein isoform X2 [Columba livia]|uniref:MAP3K7 C-terminal-like protein isoform X2 n=1 Tax=Columba livia TaxID=8932 RepID=UPI0031BBBDDE